MKQIVIILAVALFVAASTFANAISPVNSPKWSQLPEMVNPWGTDKESDAVTNPSSGYVKNTVVADDWLCSNGLPVTDVHWWGSYFGAQPAPVVDFFRISVHADIPAEDGGYSSPGDLLRSYVIPFANANQAFYGYDATEHTVYQYYVDLTKTDLGACPQVKDTVYWLDIEAVTANQANAYWGWHTATLGPNYEHVIDDAGTMHYYNPDNGDYDGFTPMQYQLPTGDFVSLDMAFQLTTVPEPSTIVMIGGALVGIAAVARRRFLNR